MCLVVIWKPTPEKCCWPQEKKNFEVPNLAVLCISLMSRFPLLLLRYFLNDFEMVPVAWIIIGITLVFIFHMRLFFDYLCNLKFFGFILITLLLLLVISFMLITS